MVYSTVEGQTVGLGAYIVYIPSRYGPSIFTRPSPIFEQIIRYRWVFRTRLGISGLGTVKFTVPRPFTATIVDALRSFHTGQSR